MNLSNVPLENKIFSIDFCNKSIPYHIIQQRKLRNLRMNNSLFMTNEEKEEKKSLAIQLSIKKENPEYSVDTKAEDQLEKYVENNIVLQKNWLVDGGVNQTALYPETEENNEKAVKEANANFAARRDQYIVKPSPDASTTTNDLLRKLVEQKKAKGQRANGMKKRG